MATIVPFRPRAVAPAAPPRHAPASARILLFEPDEGRAQWLRSVLLRQHYAVAVARNAEMARALAAYGAYDICMLDVAALGQDGLAFCRQLRDDGADLAIVMLHAHGATGDLLAGFEVGADAYLLGYVGPVELRAQLDALCRRQHMRRHQQ